MIFVTVGTQLPFDRLVAAVDRWAGLRGRRDVLAQVGQTSWRPRVIRSVPFMTPAEFEKQFQAASLVVAHAGMGTLISVLELGKPVIVMPRRAARSEHRNDHQMATVRRFGHLRGVTVALTEQQMLACLDQAVHRFAEAEAAQGPAVPVSPELIEAIRTFIAGPEVKAAARRARRDR